MALLGPYATEAEALAACGGSACCDGEGESLEGHPDLELVVSGGTYAGTYVLTSGGGSWGGSFAVGETEYAWRLGCVAGVWTLTLRADPDGANTLVASETDEPEDCDPLALSFPQDDYGGAETPLTVALAA